MTEIETVTVTFEEFKANFEHYRRIKATKRIVVLHEGQAVAVIGPWLPHERRFISPKWFFDELFGREPVDMESLGTRAILEDRGHAFTETPPPSSSSS
jgi:hypothetical protein